MAVLDSGPVHFWCGTGRAGRWSESQLGFISPAVSVQRFILFLLRKQFPSAGGRVAAETLFCRREKGPIEPDRGDVAAQPVVLVFTVI